MYLRNFLNNANFFYSCTIFLQPQGLVENCCQKFIISVIKLVEMKAYDKIDRYDFIIYVIFNKSENKFFLNVLIELILKKFCFF